MNRNFGGFRGGGQEAPIQPVADLPEPTAAEITEIAGRLANLRVTLGTVAVPARDGFHNFLDREITWSTLLPARLLYKNFAQYSCNISPFNNVNRDNIQLLLAISYVYGIGKGLLDGGPGSDMEHYFACAVGETLAPALPAELFLPEAAARDKLVSVVRCLLSDRHVLNIITDGTIMETYRVYLGYEPAGEGVDRLPNLGQPGWANVHMTPIQAMNILALLGNLILRRRPQLPLKLLLAMMIGTVKKGSVSNQFSRKITQGIEQDLGITVVVEPSIVMEVYNAYGSYVTPAVVRATVAAWTAWTPQSALRIQLILDQLKWEGLTAFSTIRETVRMYPDFPWHALAVIPPYGGQMDAFCRASDVVGDDFYYGFNRDLGVVAAANYRGLASMCAHLRNNIGGDENILRAMSLGAMPNAGKVDGLISEYSRREVPRNAEFELPGRFYRCATGNAMLIERDGHNDLAAQLPPN